MSAKKKAKLQSEFSNQSQEKLPHHLIVKHILPKLPAKSLLRFKTVRKDWLTDISSPEFQKTYFELSCFNHKFLLLHVSMNRKMFFLSYDESRTTVKDLVELHSDDLDQHCDCDDYYIVDTCKGIVCLHMFELDDFTLWNPSTNQYKTIPSHCKTIDNVDEDVHIRGVGFGYASAIDDYKIFAMYQRFWDDGFSYFYLFSLHNGTWRRLDIDGDYYSRSLGNINAVCIDDTLYWPFCNEETQVMVGIVGFDLVNDQMKRVEKVPWLHNYREVDQIFVMEGCLSLCCRKDENHASDVWILKQHPKIWLKFLSIDCKYGAVLGFTGNGKCLVQHSGQLKLIDPTQEDIDRSQEGADCDYDICGPGYKYVESLVSF